MAWQRGKAYSQKLLDTAVGKGRTPREKADAVLASITPTANAADLSGRVLWIEDRKIQTGRIETSPRIGVDYAGEYKDRPWRFFERDNPHVSRPR